MSISKWMLLASALSVSSLSLTACQSFAASPKHAASAATVKAQQEAAAVPRATAADTELDKALASFPQCIGQLQQRARKEGISEQTNTQVLAKLNFNPRILELDRKQPEFSETFANYLNKRVTPARVEQGRQLARQYRDLLQKIQQQYGVPPQYVLAFWGLETNYGGYFGKLSTLDSLATLACDPRRSEYFTTELMDALRIVDHGDIPSAQMIGSWAGAMGHTQFMPSVFLRYAVDADGDGHRDIWNSIPDALTSAANFLHGIGWNPNLRWGREVKLPARFAYEQAGLDTPKSLAEWSRIGVLEASGQPLPQADIQAALLIPAGHRGPAFLVYDNFRVIMGWNRSEYYALSVGLLADQIAGQPGLQKQPPNDLPRLTREQVTALQTQLAEQGYAAGTADGIMGPATRKAIRAYQLQHRMIADGYPDRELFKALKIDLQSPAAP